MSDSTYIKITSDNAPFTVVNRFVPRAEDQEELVRVLTDGISTEMAPLPGFISAAVHRSVDSADVLVYAQWESGDALAAAGAIVQQGGAPNMARGFELGQPEYHPYEISAVIFPAFGSGE
jgi:Antibiotic biosynthesis monooxygenase